MNILSMEVVLRGQTDARTDGRREMTKLIDAFRNFAEESKRNVVYRKKQ
jgi:hypothetical protein